MSEKSEQAIAKTDIMDTSNKEPCLYTGLVTHKRNGKVKHSLSYKVASVYLPLDKLDEADKASRLFSINHFNIMSFHEKDHMDEGYGDLTSFVQDQLQQSGAFQAGETLPSHISLLAFPRFLGHAFNPLSIFFCHDDEGQLSAILYQVRNTFGQRHHYLYRTEPKNEAASGRARLQHEGAKNFYVSPFLDLHGKYDFSIKQPAETLSYSIRMTPISATGESDGLTATYTAQRLPLSTPALMNTVGTLWQSGWKILAAIHLEALKLWFKGAPFHKRPPLPSHSVSTLSRPSVGKGTAS